MSDKYKKTCKYLNQIEHLLILASTITSCFNFCICCISLWSCWYLKCCIRNRNLCKKKKKKHDKIVLLVKDKLNTIEVVIAKALINSYVSYDKFVSVNNV